MLGETGLLANANGLSVIVDLSTNSLALSRELAKTAAAQDIHYLDAPVSGGKVAARDGTLAVMVGGARIAFDRAQPLIACFGKHIFYLGEAGAGTLTKLVNNQIFLSASVLIQEGFVLGAKAGMDPNTLLEVLKVSSAGPLLARANLVLGRNFNLDLFALGIAAKDVELALATAQALGVAMPATEGAFRVYEDARAQGLSRQDFYATVKVLERSAQTELPPLKKPGATL